MACESALSTTSRPPGAQHAQQVRPVADVRGALGVEEHEVPGAVVVPRQRLAGVLRAQLDDASTPAWVRLARAIVGALRLDLQATTAPPTASAASASQIVE